MVEEEEGTNCNATVTAVTLCTRASNCATRGVPDAGCHALYISTNVGFLDRISRRLMTNIYYEALAHVSKALNGVLIGHSSHAARRQRTYFSNCPCTLHT